jgi:glycosyltransferase domain-containing protein
MFSIPEFDYTLLIPTFNRPTEFSMLLRYLARHRAQFPIVILDVSDRKTQEANARQLAVTPLNIVHRRFSTAAPVYETICAGLAEVETPYSSLLPDDDILLPDGLASALAFLREHPDFIAAQGYHIGFAPHQDGIRLINIPEWCPSIDQDSPLERLFHLARRYQPVCYAVYRTDALASSHASAIGLDSRVLSEKTQAFVATCVGKLARLPVIYRFRREEMSILSRDQVHVFGQFLVSPEKLARDYVACRERLVEAFMPSSQHALSRNDVIRVIDLICVHFLNRHFDPARTELAIKQTLGLISAEAFAQEEAARRAIETRQIVRSEPQPSRAMQFVRRVLFGVHPPPFHANFDLFERALDIPTNDGRTRRFWIGAGVQYDLQQNPEIALPLENIRCAISAVAEYF